MFRVTCRDRGGGSSAPLLVSPSPGGDSLWMYSAREDNSLTSPFPFPHTAPGAITFTARPLERAEEGGASGGVVGEIFSQGRECLIETQR